jgi:hypothetical protein
MSGRFGVGGSTAGVNTANTPYFGVRGSSSQRLRLVEVVVGIITAPTTVPYFQLRRLTAWGTPATAVTPIAFDVADAPSGASFARGWSAAPTLAADPLMVGALAVTAGGAWIWSMRDSPIVVPASVADGIAVVNANASGSTVGAFVCSMMWDE